MAGPAPKAPRKGRAATPALLSGQTDNPPEAEKPPAAPPVDQSTGAAGPEAGAASPHASEQAAGEGAASAVAGIAAAPAALPSGAAAGVDPFTLREARGSSAGTDSPVHPGTGEAVSTAPAGDASADPAGASQGDQAASSSAEAWDRVIRDTLENGLLASPVFIGLDLATKPDLSGEFDISIGEASADPAEISDIHELLVDDEVRAKLDEAEASGLLDDAVFVEMLLRYPIRVAAGATRWRAGIFWTARETRVLQPGELDVVQFFRIVRDRDFTVHILTNVFGQPGE